ncbi:sigma factor-like helix-turn-helix DNA-binding protein [Streptomyces sp.]|uniref:sigma factor-like helix-turn-helix DNA-binding protein n=1 Tax=Streptomyces sp. TaxID=1931 RepID=UPI002F925930
MPTSFEAPAVLPEDGSADQRLRAVAYRMLGSAAEADAAVRETRLRLGRADAGAVDDLGRWLTTAVGQVSLDMLRSRDTGGDRPYAAEEPADPEERALVGVLDTLTPTERLAFVLHDLFEVPIDEIAPIVERTPAATRQLAARARRRTQGLDDLPEPDPARQREVVTAFLASARGGDIDALLDLLDPDAVLRADATAAGAGVTTHGARAVAHALADRASAAAPMLVDGVAGLATPEAVYCFTVLDGRITAIDLVADEDHLARLDLHPLGEEPGAG